MSSGVTVADAREVSKHYHVYGSFWRQAGDALLGGTGRSSSRIVALDGVTLRVDRGECVGVMGPNGAGKSTLLRILTGSLLPTSGTVRCAGRVILLDLGGLLHPRLTGRENLRVGALALGLSPAEVRERIGAMIGFSGLGGAIDDLLATYSSGMAMRLSFSLFAHAEPDLLIVDEAFAVGDARFMLKCARRLHELMRNGTAIMLVSHDASAIQELCQRGIVLERGRVIHRGDPVSTVEAYHSLLGVPPERRGGPGSSGGGGAGGDREGDGVGAEALPTVRDFLARAESREVVWGPGDRARIVAHRFLRNGSPADGVFRFGDECTAEWLVEVRRTVPLLTSGVHVHTQLGTYVFGTSYIHLGMPLQGAEPGYYRLAIAFEVLLGPGRYVASLGVAEPDEARHSRGGLQHDRLLEAFGFEVLPFDLRQGEPVPFFGLARLPARAAVPQRLSGPGG